MDWRTLFLSPEGRIGQKDYWIGVLILFVVWGPVSRLAHAGAAGLAPADLSVVCVYAKRLHDAGRSGWLDPGAGGDRPGGFHPGDDLRRHRG